MGQWDPATYLRYGDERARPFFDLLGRVGADRPRAVADLGCGPGNLTATLADRWPQARIEGLDSSPEMIGRARTAVPGVEFATGDLRDWAPAPDIDVLLSNAALQWVPGHEALLTRWARQLPAGGWLAMQVPGNFAAPSHQALRAVAAEPRFADRLAGLLRAAPVRDAAGYAALLTTAGCAVDAWETTYLHLLPADPGADHPVLRWLDGTALGPVRATLAADDFAVFRQKLGVRLAAAYPVRDNLVYFPFHRIFVVARTGSPAVPAGPPAGTCS